MDQSDILLFILLVMKSSVMSIAVRDQQDVIFFPLPILCFPLGAKNFLI